MSRYKVKCLDMVRFTVVVEADNIEEAKEEAALQIRYGIAIRKDLSLYDYVSITDEDGVCVWNNPDE